VVIDDGKFAGEIVVPKDGPVSRTAPEPNLFIPPRYSSADERRGATAFRQYSQIVERREGWLGELGSLEDVAADAVIQRVE
jgi:hypothetical protein